MLLNLHLNHAVVTYMVVGRILEFFRRVYVIRICLNLYSIFFQLKSDQNVELLMKRLAEQDSNEREVSQRHP